MTDYAGIYAAMHAESADRFAGLSVLPHVDRIHSLIRQTKSRTLLDYGSGKGAQYTTHRVHELWAIMPTLYDIGIQAYSKKPYGEFDGVICTDVLEHIDEPDLDGLVDEIFGYARKFVFLAITCRPAKKLLPDGRNAHLTVEPPDWWRAKLMPHRHRFPDLLVVGSFML